MLNMQEYKTHLHGASSSGIVQGFVRVWVIVSYLRTID